jgi:hypothetical protein
LEGEGPVEGERVWGGNFWRGGNEICPVLFVFFEQFDFVFLKKKMKKKTWHVPHRQRWGGE